MRIERLRWVLVGVALLAVATPLFAQEAEETTFTTVFGEEVIKVVKLRFVTPVSMYRTIQKLELPVSVTTVGDGKIMIRGLKKNVEHVITSVVKVLDVPEDDEGNIKTAILPLPTGLRRADDVIPLIHAVAMRGRLTQIAVDDRTRTLVVRAPQKDIEAIKSVLAHLSHPTRAVLVECFFIRGKLSGETDGEAKLPKHLSSVGKALGESGMSSLELLAPMMISAQEGTRFESSATFGEPIPRNEGRSGQLAFAIEGVVRLGGDGGVAEITIEARVYGQYRNENTPEQGRRKEGQTQFNLETSVAIPVGDYAILAASPSSTAGGDIIALAIRVTTK